MVAVNPAPQKPAPAPYAGPRDSDPLTKDELSLLLAIPRAARASPDATLFRLPRGTDPTIGYVDATCAETYSIVSRLAAQYDIQLSGILRQSTQGPLSKVGPGTTICMIVQPPVLGLFHLLAFLSLGCTIQCIPTDLDGPDIDYNLVQSGCKIIFHSGMGETWVQELGERFDGDMVELPKDEYAHRLVELERQKTVKSLPVWPTPRRPTPAFILQSSGTTGTPKLLKFSLYFYTIGLKSKCQKHLASANAHHTRPKAIYTHPRLIISPSYWQSFYPVLFLHLSTATPLALAPVLDADDLSPGDFIAWVKSLDAGGVTCTPYFIREILVDGTHTQVLKDMYSIQVVGFAIDEQTSGLFEKHGLAVTNSYGSSEFNRALYAPSAPYSHLRPHPGLPSPLFNPLTERGSDGSRDVELWYSASSSPWFAHVVAHGGIPVDLQPFPGEGPHFGEPAVNSKDIFREIIAGPSNESRYMYLGRADDHIRYSGGRMDLSALDYEVWLRSSLERSEELGGWRVDVVQLFGSGMPAVSLVVQLRPSTTEDHSAQKVSGELGSEVTGGVARCVEEVNLEMNLGEFGVDPKKRLLVLTTTGGIDGSGVDRVIGSNGENPAPRLALTHKHSLRRWANVQTFKPWLDRLDYSQPCSYRHEALRV